MRVTTELLLITTGTNTPPTKIVLYLSPFTLTQTKVEPVRGTLSLTQRLTRAHARAHARARARARAQRS